MGDNNIVFKYIPYDQDIMENIIYTFHILHYN